jgi:hypothetical protein
MLQQQQQQQRDVVGVGGEGDYEDAANQAAHAAPDDARPASYGGISTGGTTVEDDIMTTYPPGIFALWLHFPSIVRLHKISHLWVPLYLERHIVLS